MKTLKTFISAILAGASIAIGGTVYLSLENKIVGAFLFAVGLFVVCYMSFNLFTGKVCYLFDNKPKYIIDLIIIWLGNLVGTAFVALAIRATRVAPALIEKAQALAKVKVDDSFISLLVLGFFCNIMIYIAVEGYKTIAHGIGKYLAIVFGVMVFILCGFEHCVADMFYFALAGEISGGALVSLLIITLGNAIGGVFIPLLRKVI